MPRSRMFGIYAFVGIVALSAGLLIARVFGSSTNLPAGYEAPTEVIGQIETAATSAPAPSATAAAATAPAATPAPSVAAQATQTPALTASPVTLPVASPTAPPTAPAASYIEYTVQKGDILKTIAQKYGVTVEEILAINQIRNPDSLSVASVIRIPKK